MVAKENDIFLSFLIPTYNRYEVTKTLVEQLLQYQHNDIEVIAVDNCSTDGTVEKLKSLIHDDRLTIIRNKKNIGASGNGVEMFRYSRGKYSFVALARDGVRTNRIAELIEYLKNNDFSLVYCGNDQLDTDSIKYKKGLESVKRWGYGQLHPTGMVYKTEYIQKVIKEIPSENAKQLLGDFSTDCFAAQISMWGGDSFLWKSDTYKKWRISPIYDSN